MNNKCNLLLGFILLCKFSFSQLLLNEDFNYKTGKLTVSGVDNVSKGKWEIASGGQMGSLALNVDTGNLSYLGYYSALNTSKCRYINPWGFDYDRAINFVLHLNTQVLHIARFLLKVNSYGFSLTYQARKDWIFDLLGKFINYVEEILLSDNLHVMCWVL
jgi:hypothetical protein